MTSQTKKIFQLINQETKRQQDGLVMIPSENYASRAVLQAMGSPLSNKYSEGYPGKRYYTGNEIIDQIENLAHDLALKIFNLSPKNWQANVQPHSGSSANLAIYLGLLKPGDKIMALNLAEGGHLTHGSPVNFSGKLFNFIHYGVDAKTGLLDYQKIANLAKKTKPKMIVCGFTAYPAAINFKKFGAIAKTNNALLLADISHLAGLIVAGVHPSPFPFADIVTSTTHKTLAGPRGAFIIARKELATLIDKAVFPGLQGGPLDNIIAAKAVCFAEATTKDFKNRQKQTIKNAKVLAELFIKNGLTVVAGGTDTHLILLDCRPLNLTGKEAANLLAQAEIYANANMIPNDSGTPLNPSGLRLGTPALTTRGLKESEMKLIASWIIKILKNPNDKKISRRVRNQVRQLTKKFPIY